MEPHNRHGDDNFYLALLVNMIRSIPSYTQNSKDLSRDLETVRLRVSHEGFSFLTKTLPKLGKSFDQALLGHEFNFEGFKRASKAKYPAFLRGMFQLVFDSNGCIRGDADSSAVSNIRQICYAFYKLELPYSAEQENSVINGFLAVEEELALIGDVLSDELAFAASYIIRDVFADFDPRDITPRHGPGAVATGEKLDNKWSFGRLYNGIHQVYPYYDYFIVGGGRELIDRLDWYKSLKREESGTAKVVLVPKDSRGPRLISCEPLEYQWVQQGLGRKIVSHLESFKLTRGRINFSDQEINARIALESSKTQRYATLDLKDASDRVSLALVRRLFGHSPELLRALLACRSTATVVDSRQVPLQKYAPMGSALCFPVLSVSVWALACAAISRHTGLQRCEVAPDVFVYGDDLIVKTEYAEVVADALETVHLKVNRSKSCYSGHFRESCGMDAFKGIEVTPLRFRTIWHADRTDASVFASYTSYANDLEKRGYYLASNFLFSCIEETFGALPYGLQNSSYPCRETTDYEQANVRNARLFPVRWSEDYQRFEFKIKRVISMTVDVVLDSWQRLLRDVVSPQLDPSVNTLPRRTKVRACWTAV